MPRKIETQITNAIRSNERFQGGNTVVAQVAGLTEVFLHGHCIARRDDLGEPWQFNLCGWNTPTTRSRLNAIAQAVGVPGVFTRAGVPLCAGRPVPLEGWFIPGQ